MTRKASDFVFAIGADPSDPIDLGVAITSKAYFDAEGHMECVHVQKDVEAFWPKGLDIDEAEEGFFLISEDIDVSREELIEMFTAAGFIHSPALEALFS